MLFLIFFPAHLGDDLPLLRAGAEHEAAVVADAALVEPLAGLQLRGPRTGARRARAPAALLQLLVLGARLLRPPPLLLPTRRCYLVRAGMGAK